MMKSTSWLIGFALMVFLALPVFAEEASKGEAPGKESAPEVAPEPSEPTQNPAGQEPDAEPAPPAPTEEQPPAPESASAEQPKVEEPAPAVDEDDAFLNPEKEEAAADKKPEKEVTDPQDDADEAFLTDTEKQEIEAPIEDEALSLKEDPKKGYYSLGARFRWLMVPEWTISMFGIDVIRPSGKNAAIPIVNSPAAGMEFTYRKAGLDIIAAVWWADISWDETIAFKGSDEDHNSWEITENDMQAIMLTADFIWSHSFTDWVAITYGLGAGLGIRFGEVITTEATHASGHTEKCAGPQPIDPDPDCQPGEEYGKPDGTVEDFVVFPWVNFLLGFRFKPHRHIAVNVDGGFGFGFQVGTRIAYIF